MRQVVVFLLLSALLVAEEISTSDPASETKQQSALGTFLIHRLHKKIHNRLAARADNISQRVKDRLHDRFGNDTLIDDLVDGARERLHQRYMKSRFAVSD